MIPGILWLLTVSALPFSGDVARDAIESFDPARIQAVFAKPPKKPDLLAAKTPEAAGEQLRRYFSYLGHKGLAAVQQDADTTLALQAAWLLALGPGDTKTPACPKQFVRFLESRIGVKVPARWEDNLSMTAFRYSPDYYRLRRVAQKEHATGVASRARELPGKQQIIHRSKDVFELPPVLWTPAGTLLPRRTGKIVFQSENTTVEVREADLPERALAYPVCFAMVLHFPQKATSQS